MGWHVIRGTKTGAYTIYGDYPELIKQEQMDIVKGRFVNQQDIVSRRKVAIIGKGVITELYKNEEEVIGTYIKINGINFMVIGVYKSKGNNGGNGEGAQKNIFIPFTTFQQAFNYGDIVGWMALTAKDDASITDLKPGILSFMRVRHTIHPDDERAVGNFDLFQEFQKVQDLFMVLKFTFILLEH